MSQQAHMSAPPATPARLSDLLVIVLFAAMLLTPGVMQLVGPRSDPAAENRVLTPLPKVQSLRELKFLPKMSENYVNDRFGLRQQLVRLNSLLRFNLGLSSSKDVVVGKDGWLFYTADKLTEQHTGADVFTPAALENWVTWMEANRDWLARRGIAFYIVVAPDKNTIYPEKLPDYPRRPGGTTRLDQLLERLRRSTLEFIDPREALFKAKAAGQTVYFEGDTHWTERGAFVAYSLLMERMRQRFPAIEPLTEKDYVISRGPPAAVDLTAVLALQNDITYTVDRMVLRGPGHQVAPPVTTFRPGWGWRVVEMKTDLRDKPRLLVFGDSFTDYVLGPTMLYQTFRDPVWTHHNGGTFNFTLVNEVKPDVVIFQLAERYLHMIPYKPVGFDAPAERSSGR
jgi:alginate O-acetyltransferase complex protein AlgJ